MNTKCLHAFLNVMDEGSVAAAALKMHLSQPAVSRLIQVLEQQVEAQLFYRDQKYLVPTPEAERFYGEAQRVVTSIAEFPDFFAQLRDRTLVPFRIIAQLRTAPGLVTPALCQFANAMPEVGATLDIHPRRELGRRVAKTKFEVGVFVLPFMAKQIDYVSKYRVRLNVLLPVGHRLATRKRLTPSDLVDESYIALRSGLMARQAVDRELARTGEELKIQYEMSAPAAAHRMVAEGAGFTFSDPTVLEPEMAERTVLVPWHPKTHLEIGVYVPKDSQNDASTKMFFNCMERAWSDVSNRSARRA